MLVVDLPVDLLALALRFADHHALLRVELACRRLRAVATQFGASASFALVPRLLLRSRVTTAELWRELAQRHLLLDAACQRQRRPVGWKRLALLATRPPQLVERSRLTRVRGAVRIRRSRYVACLSSTADARAPPQTARPWTMRTSRPTTRCAARSAASRSSSCAAPSPAATRAPSCSSRRASRSPAGARTADRVIGARASPARLPISLATGRTSR
jgi:hypothetical protein